MTVACRSCFEALDDENVFDSRPDLICPDDPNEPFSPICSECLPRLEEQATMEFICNECLLVFKGNRISMTAFGMFCSECMVKEGFELPTLTIPPEGGWHGRDVGRTVFIKGEHGVIIKDTIIMSSLRGPDVIIGPSTYVAEIHARIQTFNHMTSTNTYEEGLSHLLDHLHGDDDDDDDEEGVVLK
jgi:hypothetical protein